ncbi:HigA family addiction module antitoxin [Castellaniella ginsengisoli]|uniref:HigA family addiction module antitoxin n=1 Tax=Castellaniella ginsengisoli TaxID=546114 RepID=A0AB39DAA4_9BURK
MRQKNHCHPGDILRDDVAKPLSLTVPELAARVGVSSEYLSEVLNGHKGISDELAERLEIAGISTARFWKALQAQYDKEQDST